MDPQFFSKCTATLETLAGLTDIGSLNETISNEDGSEIEIGDTIADPTPSIEEQMIIEDMNQSVRDFVLSLSPYLQCIVIRRYWLDHSPQKIANDLGRKRPAVYDALKRISRLGQRDLATAFTM